MPFFLTSAVAGATKLWSSPEQTLVFNSCCSAVALMSALFYSFFSTCSLFYYFVFGVHEVFCFGRRWASHMLLYMAYLSPSPSLKDYHSFHTFFGSLIQCVLHSYQPLLICCVLLLHFDTHAALCGVRLFRRAWSWDLAHCFRKIHGTWQRRCSN